MNSATNAKKAEKKAVIDLKLTEEQRQRLHENCRRLSEYSGARELERVGPAGKISEHLEVCLRAAVPMWIERACSYSPERFRQRSMECADAIAEMGDAVEHKRSNTREAFNALTEGLALATIASGGQFEFEGMIFHSPEVTTNGTNCA